MLKKINKQKTKLPNKCPSTDEYITKMWYIHTMEYYSALKRNKELIYATKCMNLKTLCYMKEERHKRPHTVLFHLYEMFIIGK